MDLYEAIGLLGLEPFIGTDYTEYTSKDVEKCFRQQALRHHPDKGGDASYFQLLHRAKDMLLEYHKSGNSLGTAHCKVNDANSTAVSTSLYEHRTCIRQVQVVHGTREAVIAATDDGLIVVELKKDANYYLSGGLERVVSFTTHRDDCSFLCCTTGPPASDGILYAGAKDGFIHKIDLSTHRLTPWQLPSRERIVTISAIRDWVAVATADGGLYVFEYENDSSTPTMVWRGPRDTNKRSINRKRSFPIIIPEIILLEEGSSSVCLNLWIGGSSSDNVTGKIVMWELNTEEDFYERFNDDTIWNCDIYDSDTDSCSEEKDDDDGEWNAPAIDLTIQEGPIFSFSKHKNTIAVASGQFIIVWEYNESSNCLQNGVKRLNKIKTIQTDNKTLYTLCINERFIAAAGSGETIMVWGRDLWTMLHHLPLQRSPSGCCLATNCIMTLDWFHDDSGILVSGGYDGIVTMWTVANRLEC